jgi:hypothetical protein
MAIDCAACRFFTPNPDAPEDPTAPGTCCGCVVAVSDGTHIDGTHTQTIVERVLPTDPHCSLFEERTS